MPSCPYCDHSLPLPVRVTPGRFRVSCPGCSGALEVLGDGAAWRVFAAREPHRDPAVVGSGSLRSNSGRITDVGPSPDFDDEPRTQVARNVFPDDNLHSSNEAAGKSNTMFRPGVGEKTNHRPADSCQDDDGGSVDRKVSIPGYVIEKSVGRGGMGTVYLARQISLDRPVALKVMTRRWAKDPVFLARFTREAYAAAQLNHPNVVQIYDIGECEGSRYFSMEYVNGRSLADMIRSCGKIDPETAVGYVLQAARGLKHAHDRGMIHRDVKPDNLLLDDQGVLKVADLGLVKTPESTRDQDSLGGRSSDSGLHSIPANMTGTRMALGTPAYMAPEQCRDAATVDHRADIYSLGCTLYALVTGRQPFDGTTPVELMTKHAYEQLVPPEVIVTRVPKELSAVIQKMMAKDRNERFATMGEVVAVLEQWLGVHHTGTFSPRDEQIDQLESLVNSFNTAPTYLLRGRIVATSVSLCVLFAILLTFFGKLTWAFGLAALVIQSAAASFILNGMARKPYFFRRVRQFLFGLTAGDWIVTLALGTLYFVMLWILKLFWIWTGFGLIGIAVAFALRFGLDRQVDTEREGPLVGCGRLLRRLRRHGLGEQDLHQFVAKYAGRNWEEFFEAMFGFEEKLTARALLLRAGSAGVRERFGGWREPLLNLIDRVERVRRESQERQMLLKTEQNRLLAAGLSMWSARNRAAAAASAMIRHANAARSADTSAPAVGMPTQPERAQAQPGAPDLRPIIAQSGAYGPALRPVVEGMPPRNGTPPIPDKFRPEEKIDRFIDLFIGRHVRAAIAILMLFACGFWVYQNGILTRAIGWSTPAEGEELARYEPLLIDGFPPEWTMWCDSVNIGWAGALFLASVFFTGNRMAFMVFLGAGIAIFGHRYGIRTVEPLRDTHASLMLGTVVSLIGYRLGQRA